MKDQEFQKVPLRDYVDVLLRRRGIALTFFLSIILATAGMSLYMHPIYESTTLIQLEDEKKMGLPFGQFEEFMRSSERVKTQVEILKSRNLAERVVKKLNLQFQMEPEDRMYHLYLKRWTQDTKKKKIPESLPNIRVRPIALGSDPQTGEYKGVFRDSKGFIICDEDGEEIGKGQIGRPFEGADFSFLLEGPGSEGKSFRFRILSSGGAIMTVIGNLEISPVRDTSLIKIATKWDNPAMAREIASTLVEEYKAITILKRTKEASHALSFIEGELHGLGKDLRKAEEKLEKFKKEKGFVTLNDDAKSALEQITIFEKEYKTMESYRKQAEAVLAELKKPELFLDKDALFSLGAGLNNQLIIQLGTKLAEFNISRSSLDPLLTKEHPRFKQLYREIEDVKKSIIGEITSLISSLKVSEENLQASMKKYEARIQYLPAAEKELFDIMRVVKVGQDLSSFLLQKRGEMSISKASELGNIWVVDPPVFQPSPVKPNVPLNIILSFITGIVLSVSLAFFVEYLDTTVKTSEELQKITDLPFLGPVFHFIPDKKILAGDLKMLEDPHSHIAEAFRTIRTNLLFATLGEPKKFFLITSAGSAEGKTFVSANLAVALAQSGKRVLIVDSDLRKPSLDHIFRVEKSPGLTNVLLSKEIEHSSLPIKKTLIENLEFISSGDHPPNPSELLDSERMERFLSVIREKYDCVLFDSPPAFLASDSFVIAQRVDGVIFVARRGIVEKDILQETLNRFSKLNAKILGIVFNDVYREGSRYYYKYSYYYEEDGKKGRKKKKVGSPKTQALPPGNTGDRP